MHIKFILLIIISSLVYLPVNAQYLEAGLFGGVANYNGDLSTERINVHESNPAFGGFLRYNISPRFALRLSLMYGKLTETDADSDISYIRVRNLSFRSNVYEFSLLPEINLFSFGKKAGSFTPYFFTGISVFHFNPQALYNREWVDLQPLGTEGQGTTAFPAREKYSLVSYAIPVGLGIKILLNDVCIGIESGLRRTFTDYIDDVSTTYVDDAILLPENGSLAAALSNRTGEVLPERLNLGNTDQRGNPATRDYYAFTGVTISFLLGAPSDNKSGYGCPKF